MSQDVTSPCMPDDGREYKITETVEATGADIRGFMRVHLSEDPDKGLLCPRCNCSLSITVRKRIVRSQYEDITDYYWRCSNCKTIGSYMSTKYDVMAGLMDLHTMKAFIVGVLGE